MRTPAFAGFNITGNKACGMFECRMDEAGNLKRVGSTSVIGVKYGILL